MLQTAVHAQASAHDASATAGHADAEGPDVELHGGSLSRLQLLRLVDEALAAMAAGRRPETLEAMRAAGQHELADQVEDERDVRLTLDGQTREERAEWIKWVRAWRGEEAATRVETAARRRWRDGEAFRRSVALEPANQPQPQASPALSAVDLERMPATVRCAGTMQPMREMLLPLCIGCDRLSDGGATLVDAAAITHEPGYSPAWSCAARLPRLGGQVLAAQVEPRLPDCEHGASLAAEACTSGERTTGVPVDGSFHQSRHAGNSTPVVCVDSDISPR